jgi:hypothetical protein
MSDRHSEIPEAAVLRAYGYTDEQIGKMSPTQRVAEYQDAIEAGVSSDSAEFIEMKESFGKKKGWPLWVPIAIACTIVLGIYWMFFSSPASKVVATTTPFVAGWEELGSCMSVASLDGMKQLSLHLSGAATLKDDSPEKDGEARKDRSLTGYWRLNEGSKRYTVTFKEESTSYLLVTSDHAPVCMLVKGDIAAADLRESWFSSTAVEDDPGDYEMPDCGR